MKVGMDIATLPNDTWYPIERHRQSRYVDGLCERCGDPIAAGESHETRAWRNGPAMFCQHTRCSGEREEEHDEANTD